MFPGLDLYSIGTDHTQNLINADMGCAVHDLDRALDRDLFKACNVMNVCDRIFLANLYKNIHCRDF